MSFQQIEINAGTLTAGQTLTLNAIGTNTANMSYVFPSGFTVAAGATINVGPNVTVSISPGQTFTDNGTVNFASGDTVALGASGYSATQLGVGGTLTAIGTTFTIGSGTIAVNNGGNLNASNSAFSLPNLILNNGSNNTLSADIIGRAGVTTLFTINSGATISIAGNDLSNIGAKGVIATGNSGQIIDLSHNYWGTSVTAQIDAKILDHADDVTRPTINYQPFQINGIGTLAVTPVTKPYSASDQTFAFSASVTSSTGTNVTEGTVTFNVLFGSNVIGSPVSGTVSNGSVTSSPYTLPGHSGAGMYTIQAIYSDPAGTFLGAIDAKHFLTVTQDGTATAVTADATVTYNPSLTQTIHLTATVDLTSGTGAVDAGMVTFTVLNGATPVGSPVAANVAVVGGEGVASADYVLPIAAHQGTYRIQASYGGTNDFLASSQSIHTLTVTQADTVTVASSASATFNASAGQTVPLSTGINSAVGTVNEGTATFGVYDTLNILKGSATVVSVVNGSANAKYALPSNLGIGTYTIKVNYADVGGNFKASSDATQTLSVTKAGTTTTVGIASATYSGLVDQPLTLTANVGSASGAVSTGTVRFTVLNGAIAVGAAVANVALDASGTATTTLYMLPARTAALTYTVKAEYSGGAGSFLDSAGLGTVLTVSPATSTVAALAGSSPSYSLTLNQDVVVSATVSSSRGTVAAGNVTFRVLNGNTVVGTPVSGTVDVNGLISKPYTIPAGTAAGTYGLEAVYGGSTNFVTSTDATHTLIVAQAISATAPIASSVAFNAALGQNVSVSATVSSGGKPVNEGTERITILKGAIVIGAPITANVTGGASIPTSYALPAALPGGPYTMLAEYLGSTNYLPSSSQADVFVVNAANTTTTGASAGLTYDGVNNQTINLSATITSPAGTPGEGTATFTVTASGNVVVASAKTANVVNGAASVGYLIPAGTPGGTYSILVSYNGTGNYKASGDVTKTLTMTAAASSLATSTPSAPDVYSASSGQSVPVSTTITSSAGTVSGGMVTFTVMRGATVVGTPLPVPVDAKGVASGNYVLPAATGIGSYTVQAAFTGTANFAPFTDASQTIHVSSPTVTKSLSASTSYDATAAQTLTFTANLTSDSGDEVNIGSVTFTVVDASNNPVGATASGPVVHGVVTAIYTLPANIGAGSYKIHSHYVDPPDFLNSDDNTQSLQVAPATTTAQGADAKLNFGLASQTVPLSASLSSSGGTVGEGKVTFQIKNGSIVVASTPNVTVTSGLAQAAIILPPGLSAGAYTIHTIFSGATDFQNATAPDQTLTINPAATAATTLPASTTYRPTGPVVAITASLTSAAGTVGAGSVIFTILNGAATVASTSAIAVVGGTANTTLALPAGTSAGLYTVKAAYGGTSDLVASVATSDVTIARANPSITWANPADIVYGVPLSITQLNATASVPGVLTYGQPVGTILHAGAGQTLAVSFTPADSTDYTATTAPVTLNVGQAQPVFSGLTPSQTITYGDVKITVSGTISAPTAIPSGQTVSIDVGGGLASSSANIAADGSFSATISTTTIDASPPAYTITLTYAGNTDFQKKTDSSTTLTILQAAQLITLTTLPAPLPTTVKYPGTIILKPVTTTAPPIVLSPSNSTIRDAGGGSSFVDFNQNLGPAQVKLSQAGDRDHLAATDLILNFTVAAGDASLTLGGLAATYDGLPHLATLTTTPAGIAVNLSYMLAGNPITSPIGAGIYTVTATVADPHYQGSTTQSLVIQKASSPIAWATPAPIVFGTLLSSAQFSANSPVAGTFTYNNAPGAKLDAGDNQALSVTFAATDSANYNQGSASVLLNVLKAQPFFTNLTASSTITFGQATLDLAGNLSASPVLPTGEKVTITVGSLIATSTVAADGTFSATLNTGSLTVPAQPYAIDFHYAGGVNFQPTDDASRKLTVNQATPTLTWITPAAIDYGTPLSAEQLAASASVGGSFVYTPKAGTVLGAGTQTLNATFTPTDATDYKSFTANVSLVVHQAAPSFSGLTLAPTITFGQATLTLSGKLSTAGGSNPAGDPVTIAVAGLTASPTVAADGTFGATFNVASLHAATYTINDSFAGDANFKPAGNTASTLTVTKADQAISLPTPPVSARYNSPFAFKPTSNSTLPIQLTATNATVAPDGAGGFLVTASVGSGTVTLTASQPGDSDHNAAADATTAPIPAAKGQAAVTLSGLSATYDGAAHHAIFTTSVPVGSVTITYALGGVGLANPTAAGTYDVTATVVDVNYSGSASAQLVIAQAASSLSWAAPAAIDFGTRLSAAQRTAVRSIAGSISYSFADGTLLDAGDYALAATLTPTDSTNFKPSAATISLHVNQAHPSFSSLTPSPSSGPGQTSVTLSGKLTSATGSPASQVVTISAGAASTTATIEADGSFSATLDASGLAASGSPYAVVYTYAGSPNFAAARDASTLLAVSVPATPPPLVVLQAARTTITKRSVSSIVLTFSGPLDPGTAGNAALYRLATAGKGGSFDAKGAKTFAIRSAIYNAAANTVTLTPNNPFALSKTVQLRVSGAVGGGVLDSFRRLIDGNHDGSAGGDAISILSKRGVSIQSITVPTDHLASPFPRVMNRVIKALSSTRRGSGTPSGR